MELQEQESSSNSVVPKGESSVTSDNQDQVLPGQPNPSYQVSMTHNVTIEENAIQENLSYQRGHVTIEEDAMQENPSYQRGHVTIEEDAIQENPSYQRGHVTIEEDAMQENPSYQRDHVTIDTNIAYSIATQPPDQNDEYHFIADTENTTQDNQSVEYLEIIDNENSTSIYEEIPNNRGALPPTPDQLLAMPVLTTKTMCSFWQGRLEIYIRVATLVVS